MLICTINGNVTDSIWSAVEATSFVWNTGHHSTVTSASDTIGATFTPGAITVDGIALNFYAIDFTKGGTITVRLTTGGVDVPGTSVTLNIADIACYSSAEMVATGSSVCVNWVFFRFDSPVTLIVSTVYTVRVRTSIASAAQVWDGSSLNVILRKPSPLVGPSSGESLLICAERGNSSALTNRVVTMNNTATSQLCFHVYVQGGGTLTWGTTASTAYYLKLSGGIQVATGGTLSIAAAGSRLPASSSATIEFLVTGLAQFGIEIFGGTVSMYGDNGRTAQTYLSSNVANSQAVLNVQAATNWVSGDSLIVASTDVAGSDSGAQQWERMSILSLSGTAITCTGNLTNTHNITTGALAKNCEVANVTDNIMIKGQSTSNTAYICARSNATLTLDRVYMRYLGGSSDAQHRSIACYGTGLVGGAITVNECSLLDCPYGPYIGCDVTITQTCTFTKNIMINCGFTRLSSNCIENVTLDHCWFIGNNSTVLWLDNLRPTVSNLTITSVNGGTSTISILSAAASGATNLNHWTIHSCSPIIIDYGNGNMVDLTLSNVRMWGVGAGLSFSGQYYAGTTFTFNNFLCDSVSNNNYWVQCASTTLGTVIFNNSQWEGAAATAGYGFRTNLGSALVQAPGLRLNNCTLGSLVNFTVSGSGSDILINGANAHANIFLDNTTLGSTATVVNNNNLSPTYAVTQQLTNGTGTCWTTYGTTSSDTTYYHAGSPSCRLTPNSTLYSLSSPVLSVPVPAGTYTFGVWLRKSSGYTGGQAGLWILCNNVLGIATDTLIGSTAAAVGNWEFVSGPVTFTTPGIAQFLVYCNGTAGWVNIDDFALGSPIQATGELDYWAFGQPMAQFAHFFQYGICAALTEPRGWVARNYVT